MARHLRCCQGFAVAYYGVTLGRLGYGVPSTFAQLRLKKGRVMKNYSEKTMGIVFCLIFISSFFMACAPTAEQPVKSAPGQKLERYEDKLIGFSIEFDAEKLTQYLPPSGPFVYRRESVGGLPRIGITADPYPKGTNLEETADLITSALPKMIPGCIIHQVNNQQLIKLKDGSEALYFELDWAIEESDLIATFGTTKKNDFMIVFGAADNEDGSMENLTAMVQSLRLDVEVDKVALKARGFAKDGKFVRTDSPAFTLEYPKAFQNRPLQSNLIFRAGIPQGSPSIAIAVSSLRAGEDVNKQLKAFAEGYANFLKSIGTGIKIISQNPINNYQEFDAYQIQIVWRYRGQTTLKTIAHIIAKEDKTIELYGHTIYAIDELTDIFKTINLNP